MRSVHTEMVDIIKKMTSVKGGGEFKIAVGLYTDEFEMSNPLGTSKKKHKMSAVYWVIVNVPSKYRSTLHCIQLPLLCKAYIKEYG